MSNNNGQGETVTTASQFSDELCQLLQSAHSNGVDVTGPWECRTDGSAPDWEATITELVDK